MKSCFASLAIALLLTACGGVSYKQEVQVAMPWTPQVGDVLIESNKTEAGFTIQTKLIYQEPYQLVRKTCVAEECTTDYPGAFSAEKMDELIAQVRSALDLPEQFTVYGQTNCEGDGKTVTLFNGTRILLEDKDCNIGTDGERTLTGASSMLIQFAMKL